MALQEAGRVDNISFAPKKETNTPVTTFVDRLLCYSITEPEGLSLAKAPISIQRDVLGDGSEKFSINFDYAFGGYELLKFLGRLAPYKGEIESDVRTNFVTVGGIVTDWDMPDRARIKENKSPELLALHAHLGRDFGDFIAQRHDFIDVLSVGPTVSEIVEEISELAVNASGYRDLVLADSVAMLLDQERNRLMYPTRQLPDLAKKFPGITADFLNDTRERIVNYMRSNPNFWKPKQIKNGLNKLPNAALKNFWNRGEKFTNNFFKNEDFPKQIDLPEDVVDHITDFHLMEEGCKKFFDENNNPVYLKTTNVATQKIQQDESGRFVVVRNSVGRPQTPLVRGYFTFDKIGVGTINVDWTCEPPLFVPEIQWVKKTDEAGQIKREMIVKSGAAVFDAESTRRVSKLIGFLAIPYLEELQNDWEEKEGILIKDKSGSSLETEKVDINIARVATYALSKRAEIVEASHLTRQAEDFYYTQTGLAS